MTDAGKNSQSSLRINIMIVFSLMIVAWGMFVTRFSQHMLKTVLVEEGIDAVSIGRVVKHFTFNSTGLTMAGMFFAVLAAIAVAKRITNPLKKLKEGVEIIRAGEFNHQVDIELNDEVGVLAAAFNTMTRDLQETTVSKNYMDSIIANMADSLIVTTTHGTITVVNQATLDSSGYTEEELIGAPLSVLSAAISLSDDLMAQGRLTEHETYFQTKDGRKYPVLISGSAVTSVNCPHKQPLQECLAFQEKGEHCKHITGLIWGVKDISSRKKLEDVLRKSEEKYRGMVEGLGEAMYRMTLPDGKYEYFSPAARSVFGYEPEDITDVFTMTRRIVHPDSIDDFRKRWEEVKAGKIVPSFEYKIIDSGGTPQWILQSNYGVYDDQGNLVVMEGICRNITEWKETERLLRKNKASLAEAQRIAHIGNWDWDIEKNELVWSDEIYRIFGLQPQEFEATYEAFMEAVHPDDRELVKKAVEEGLNKKKPYQVEHRIVLSDGSERVVHEQAKIFVDETNTVVRIIGTVHDITEHKKGEEALKRAKNELEIHAQKLMKANDEDRVLNEKLTDSLKYSEQQRDRIEEQKKELEKVNQELDSFVYTASHDLRAPLRAIASFASFIEEDCHDKIGEQGRDYVNEIRKGINQMQRLIEDLLMLSRISRIKNPYEYVPVKDLICSIMDSLRFDIDAAGADMVVQQDLPAIKCDRIKLREVFLNLVNNAIKFSSKTNDKTACVEIGYTDSNGFHEFFVRDNGIGIKPEYHEQIFGIFKRLHTASEYEGTGAGLNIVKRVIEEHQGRVWVESEFGKGATFHFTISKSLKTGQKNYKKVIENDRKNKKKLCASLKKKQTV